MYKITLQHSEILFSNCKYTTTIITSCKGMKSHHRQLGLEFGKMQISRQWLRISYWKILIFQGIM